MRNFLILILSVIFISCGDSKADLTAEINRLSDVMKQEDFPSTENMDSIVVLYDQYITAYPEDAITFDYLELKAKYLAANNKYDESIQVYDHIIAKYKNDDKVADAAFMQAFIEENYKGDKQAAEKRYLDFLEKYPDHELADDARFSIENLNLTDEQIFEKLMQMQSGGDSVVVE